MSTSQALCLKYSECYCVFLSFWLFTTKHLICHLEALNVQKPMGLEIFIATGAKTILKFLIILGINGQ